MPDWSDDLDTALSTGDPAFMKAMLGRVPKQVLQRVVPYLEGMATNAVADGNLDEALTYYGQLIGIAPDNVDWYIARAEVYLKVNRLQDALTDAKRIVTLQPDLAPGYRLQAEAHDGLRERQEAIAMYRHVLRLEPNDEKSKQRIRFLERELSKDALLRQTLDPRTSAGPLRIEVPPLPEVKFDPALFHSPAIPQSFEKTMVDGLRQHLIRYSGHQSLTNSLARLEDPAWVAAWDCAITAANGSAIGFRGSELGTLALRARSQGSTQVFSAEPSPIEERVARGIVQRNLLSDWHRAHGADIQRWSEEERRASFEVFSRGIDIIPPGAEGKDYSQCRYFAFPNIDHSLLGTGIVKAIRDSRSSGLPMQARILPARATIFAMPIQWNYDVDDFELRPLGDLQWSLFPQPLETFHRWLALSPPSAVGSIDFENFDEEVWKVPFPIDSPGRVEAIVYWFELELGPGRLGNAPGSSLQCIRPAVQYVDATRVERGQQLAVRIDVYESRLHMEIETATPQLRSHQLPSWCTAMLMDRQRHDAYRDAIGRALELNPSATVLSIGAGCGLVSMIASQSGAGQIFSCEVDPILARVGRRVVAASGLEDKVRWIDKDCRTLLIPDDLPVRADLAVFETFDCSLIGEGILHFAAHAREHLLTEQARLLPMGGKIRAIIVEYRLDRILDVDVNLLNPYRFAPRFINVDASRLNYRALTEPFDVFEFDFSNSNTAAQEKELLIPAIADGVAGAVLFWFDLQLDESTWLSNSPQTDGPHWQQGLHFLAEARVDCGSPLPLLARHDGSRLGFGWRQEAIPKERFSALPRFDPRLLAQAKELDERTRELWQHCTRDAGEYGKVAELAMRFAIDPASHGIDPTIAQRFAATFLRT